MIEAYHHTRPYRKHRSGSAATRIITYLWEHPFGTVIDVDKICDRCGIESAAAVHHELEPHVRSGRVVLKDNGYAVPLD